MDFKGKGSSMERRQFIYKFIFLGFVANLVRPGFAAKRRGYLVENRFTFKDLKTSQKFYSAERSRWENSDFIQQLNEEMKASGDLLSFERQDTHQKSVATYLFKSEDSYQKWVGRMQQANAFNHDLVPAGIRYERHTQSIA